MSTLVAAVPALLAAAPPPDAATAAVRSVLVAENRMYQDYDATVSRRVYAPDIRWQNPFGVRLVGEPAVETFLARLFTRARFRSARTVTAPAITDVRLLSPTTASAWSEEASEGQTRQDGSAVGLRKSHILYVMAKRGGRWLIVDEQIMDERD
ncbi:DUF4440 domain-containing protein [Sphingomonas bacterium]|uniref:DUF4440 domain-containing protein n=1 Tax=Sphingomonas bacterium TaxID=1895847 RepID=UPI001576FDFC|nr:DUF4440 domain-containing protein [Sphingomonas bacterium]